MVDFEGVRLDKMKNVNQNSLCILSQWKLMKHVGTFLSNVLALV